MKKVSFLALLIASLSFACQQKKEVNLFLAGDSTMSDKPLKNGHPERGWGQLLPVYLKEGIKVDNHARNGRSSKSFRSEGRWDVIMEKIQPGDYVIIQFGHNDQKYKDSTRFTDPQTEYRDNLTRYVEEVKAKGANPILATSIVRRRFDENGEFVESHGEYPQVVREVALETNVPLLDLHLLSRDLIIKYGPEESEKLYLIIKPGLYPALLDGKEDNTHLSAIGASRICDLAKAEIIEKVPQLAQYLKE